MHSDAWAREMALYSKWQNERVYHFCDGLSDEDRKRDRGMYFRSIHNTLDHILMVDVRLRSFVASAETPATAFDPTKFVYPDYDELKRERRAFDVSLLD